MVSTPSARQRRPISRWPSIASCRVPWRSPGSSLRYIDGTWVILAASGRLPMSGCPMRDVMRAERHRHVLRLEEDLVAPGAALAADAARLGAAERLPQVAHVLAVDEAHAGLDRRRHPVRAAEVLAPHVAVQAV